MISFIRLVFVATLLSSVVFPLQASYGSTAYFSVSGVASLLSSTPSCKDYASPAVLKTVPEDQVYKMVFNAGQIKGIQTDLANGTAVNIEAKIYLESSSNAIVTTDYDVTLTVTNGATQTYSNQFTTAKYGTQTYSVSIPISSTDVLADGYTYTLKGTGNYTCLVAGKGLTIKAYTGKPYILY